MERGEVDAPQSRLIGKEPVCIIVMGAAMTSAVLSFLILLQTPGQAGGSLTVNVSEGRFSLKLNPEWQVDPAPGPVLAKALNHVYWGNGNRRSNYCNVRLSSLSDAKKQLSYPSEARPEKDQRSLKSTAGELTVFESFVPPKELSNGNSWGGYDAIYLLPLKNGRHLAYRWTLTFRSFPGDFATVEEARAETAVFRQKVDAMMSSLAKTGAVPAQRQVRFGETSQSFGGVTCKVALPKGKSLKNTTFVVINIPPSGSAKLFAPSESVARGGASIALTGLKKSDPMALSQEVKKVISSVDKIVGHSKTRFIFVGFSAGGFAAASLAKTFESRCDGLVTIGSFTAAQYLPEDRKLPIVFLLGAKDFNRGEATRCLRQYSPEWNIQMLSFEGGHSWGSPSDHAAALKLIKPGST